MGRLSILELSVVGAETPGTHTRKESALGFSSTGAPFALNPWRTDSVSRGLSISLFTRETIILSISIRLFIFMKLPSLDDEQ